MVVKCVRTKMWELKDICNEQYDLLVSEERKNLDFSYLLNEGHYYAVIGIRNYKNILYFLINNCDYSTYPSHMPSGLFEIIDKRFSRYWKLPENVTKYDDIMHLSPGQLITFQEWCDAENDFYTAIVDGDFEDETVKIYVRYRELMEYEFKNPSITDAAKLIETNWVQCLSCFDAWQLSNNDEIIKCPSCNRVMLSPLA